MVGLIETIPVLPDALMGAGLGALIGGVVAQRHMRRGGPLPYDWIVIRWSAALAAVFAGVAVIAELP